MTYQEYFITYCNYYKELQKRIGKPKFFSDGFFILESERLKFKNHIKRINEVEAILNSYARYLYLKNTTIFCACCIKSIIGEWGCINDDKNDRSCPSTYLCEHSAKYFDMSVDDRSLWKPLSEIEVRNLVLSALRKNNVIAWRWLQ